MNEKIIYSASFQFESTLLMVHDDLNRWLKPDSTDNLHKVMLKLR